MVPEGDGRDGDLRARLVRVEQDFAAFVQRVLEVERWRTKTDIEEARRGEQWSNMKTQLEHINGTVTWIARLIIGAIILGVLTFIIKGGFNLPNI